MSKVQQINSLQPDVLCILFDDMKGDIPGLAERQLRIVEDILSVSKASHHVVCPTYYSFDPVLEEVFGNMPEGYLEHLGNGLPQNIDVFWTGNRVISTGFTQEDISRVTTLLSRPPVLWDNYPVNDGRLTSKYLHVKPFTGRPVELTSWCRGHLSNPMNQPWLSQCVLSSLARIYSQYSFDKCANDLSGFDELLSPVLAQCIREDWKTFHEQGLDTINVDSCKKLVDRYASFDEPAAKEIVGWLSGEYTFDPACLTG